MIEVRIDGEVYTEEQLQERDLVKRHDYVGRCNWSADQRRKVKEFLNGYLDDCGSLNY